MPTILHRFSSSAVFLAAIIFAGTMISAESSFGQDKQQGFLTNYSLFKPGAEGEANLIWVNPKFEFPGGFGAYDKVMIDPITVYFSDDFMVATPSPLIPSALITFIRVRNIIFKSNKRDW